MLPCNKAIHKSISVPGSPTDSIFGPIAFFLAQTHAVQFSDGGVVTQARVVTCAVLHSPVWTETAEHATLADLLEMVSSIGSTWVELLQF